MEKVKTKLPEENVEYTFVCKDRVYRTYIYIGLNEAGRVILMNVKTKRFTTMTPSWFNKMMKNQCIATKRIDAPFTLRPAPAPVERQRTWEEQVIADLRTLTPVQAHNVMAVIKRHPDELADELERLYSPEGDNCTQAFINRVCTDVMKALDVIRPPKNALFSAI